MMLMIEQIRMTAAIGIAVPLYNKPPETPEMAPEPYRIAPTTAEAVPALSGKNSSAPAAALELIILRGRVKIIIPKIAPQTPQMSKYIKTNRMSEPKRSNNVPTLIIWRMPLLTTRRVFIQPPNITLKTLTVKMYPMCSGATP